MAAPNFTDFMSTNSTALGTKADLSQVDDNYVVNIVKISSLEGYKDDTALNAAMRSNAAPIDEMHKQVASNTALAAKLKAADYMPEDVVCESAPPTDPPSCSGFDGLARRSASRPRAD